MSGFAEVVWAEEDGDTVGSEERLVALTRNFKETVQARARRDAAFRRALLREGLVCLLGGEVAAGKVALRDYVSAAIRYRTSTYE